MFVAEAVVLAFRTFIYFVWVGMTWWDGYPL